MTVSVFQRVKVQDFDQWLHPDPDAVAANMKAQGASSVFLARNLDDPNTLMIRIQFPDEETAKAFVPFYTQAHKESHGDTAVIQEWWLGMDVEGYCRQV